MTLKKLLYCSILISCQFISAQHRIGIEASLDDKKKIIAIDQTIEYHNTSSDTLTEIFFLDWANAFSGKTTELGKRFSEDFLKRFYYAKEEERGRTVIQSFTSNDKYLTWNRYKDLSDIIQVQLNSPLLPGERVSFQLTYQVKIPSEKFTRYGYYDNGNFHLKYWHIIPAVYTDNWVLYSHKNLDDLYAPMMDYDIKLTFSDKYTLKTELNSNSQTATNSKKTIALSGANRNKVDLYFVQQDLFYSFDLGHTEFLSDIEDNDLGNEMKLVATQRIFDFLEFRLGSYPFDKLMVSESDYKNNPVYGLNQLPDFLRPFPDGFQYEVKQLKSITEAYLENTLFINPREEAWVVDGIHILLMIDYVNQYYPKMKIVGNLSEIFGLRWFHLADLEFNDQYYLAYKNMARLMLDQPLNTPKDRLVKFNANIANAYKAGIGFKYLEDYLEDDNIIQNSIREFYEKYSLKYATQHNFKEILTKNSSTKSVAWFFEDYIPTKEKLDFKIKKVKKREDSLEVTIKNFRNNAMPISLAGIRDDQLISKTWIESVPGTKKITIANPDLDKLALDYEQKVPEINRRNNYRNLKWIFNRPLQFRFFQDAEDPRYSQVFFIPEFEFNIYDGFTVGSKFYNTTLIRRDFNYKITPFYGIKSNKLLGSAGFSYRHQIGDHDLYMIKYIFSGNMFSYAPDLLFRRFSPTIQFFYRPEDLRSNQGQVTTIRSINVLRERNEENPVTTPDYSVFNVRHQFSDFNLTNFKSFLVDYQIAKNFSKISTTLNYRKLFLNNRQINLRFFAGTFLYNDTEKDGDFFSFALDRPTDYLFDYSYLGRSEDTGFTSQQIILAEGGFKSKLDNQFANQWITTFNADTNIWNWIYLYGDVGFIKNRNVAPEFVYDSGIRLSLVQDYFEVFFPLYSNKGWEVGQPDYDERIRFIVTLSPETLIKLFTREWY
ncbi:metalloprotease [Aquimarina brevivitae]|uniref:Peptidase M1 membrane alanine aminopeptidase domain-containing protein n=1 Tax=Aquimarina brevivitae TaxID=323412 RepID=A0A4Q7P288_9FLAO|nr:metalloprotease [Aquimarina brevivitae]RZS93697.1 hypothetical protein EV197_2277 [Aquimarina brevivitae]